MSYTQQVSNLLVPFLLPSAIRDFLENEGLILEDYNGEFLIAVRVNSCYLSTMGHDMVFENKKAIQDYFNHELTALFDKSSLIYIYGFFGVVKTLHRNSAIIMLAQVREECLYLNKQKKSSKNIISPDDN